jgi:hypothetical protein
MADTLVKALGSLVRERERGSPPPRGPRAGGTRSTRLREPRDRGRTVDPPAPCRATCMRIPFVSRVRCFIPLIMASPLDEGLRLSHHG